LRSCGQEFGDIFCDACFEVAGFGVEGFEFLVEGG
jgi:hypothetical protein